MMNHLTRATIAVVAAELAMAGSIAVSGIIGLHGHAQASPGLQEDDPGWSCVDDGNRVCGPGNEQGVPAGCYDEGGVLVAVWPCYVVVNPDGSSDVYTPTVDHGTAAADGAVPGPVA